MLRANLSTRPFYNERAVRLALGSGGIVLLALTLFNVFQVIALRDEERDLSARATQARADASRLRADAQRVRAQIDPKELEVVSAAAREANALIEQRAFSWVELLAQIERTLPANVRVIDVQPTVDGNGVVSVSMGVEARSNEAIAAFTEALETDSTFRNVLPLDNTEAEDGLIDARVEGVYVPPSHDAPAEDAHEPSGAQPVRSTP
jgi:hypothetical protein